MTAANWAAFRDYDGRQLIYFTHLVAYRCGLAEIRYSLDSDALDQRFALPPCDPQQPHAIDPVAYPPYIALPLGAATTIALQVVYADGSESDIVRLKRCDNVGDRSCAVVGD